MKLLMHICCAPCANMPIDALRADGIELTGFCCLQEYAQTIALPLTVKDEYGLRPFVRAVADDIPNRCVKCYEMRLFETARQAKEGGFDAFTSSLFISPYQNHELLKDVAARAAEEYGVGFYYQDFRPMFRDGQARARELGFYIQKYCGCVFSEQERYLKPSKIIP
jgi:predicted adenine nucleotide alpha hydrolase (AANH) superfamily ATPase